MKTKEVRVTNRLMLFQCPYCGKKSNLLVFNGIGKNIQCVECGRLTRCLINRRPEQREKLNGVLTLRTRENTELEVLMRDISNQGVGFEVRTGEDLRLIKLGQDISLSCSWCPTLIPRSRFRVQNIDGFRVGAMTAMKILPGANKT